MKYRINREGSEKFNYNIETPSYLNETLLTGVLNTLKKMVHSDNFKTVIIGVGSTLAIASIMFPMVMFGKNEGAVSGHLVPIKKENSIVRDYYVVITKDEAEHLCIEKDRTISEDKWDPVDPYNLYPFHIKPGETVQEFFDVGNNDKQINKDNIEKIETMTDKVIEITPAEDIFGYHSEESIDASVKKLVRAYTGK